MARTSDAPPIPPVPTIATDVRLSAKPKIFSINSLRPKNTLCGEGDGSPGMPDVGDLVWVHVVISAHSVAMGTRESPTT